MNLSGKGKKKVQREKTKIKSFYLKKSIIYITSTSHILFKYFKKTLYMQFLKIF